MRSGFVVVEAIEVVEVVAGIAKISEVVKAGEHCNSDR